MTEAEFAAGSALGEYTTILRCGAGAYGQVYLARDGQGRRCAVKVLSPDRRGERELNGLLRFQRVSHPDLLRIHRIGVLPDGRIYYSMDAADNAAADAEAYEPDTLARRMAERGGTLPPDELKRIMLELVSGLTELHRAHLIHRDIKPENILFVGGRAVLADAGTVDDAEGASLVGTPEYLPPEVRMGRRDLTAADDCHALGKVLYSALTGEAPRKFPSTPHTLESPEQIALFRVAERACTPPGLSVYEFRRLLEHPEALRPRHRARRLLIFGALSGLIAAAVVFVAMPGKAPAPAPTPAMVPAPAEEPTVEVTSARKKASVAYGESFVRKLKTDEAKLRAEQERIKSPTVRPVGTERRDTTEPTFAELQKKYERPAEEQKLVDKWLAECVSFDRRINRAYMARDNAQVSKLMAEKKAKLPYGIADFCGDEMRMMKLMRALARDYTPDRREYTERWLKYRRDVLETLLEKLPPSELARWR